MAIDLSRTIAAGVGTPRFYLEKEWEVTLSRELFATEPMIAEGLRIVAGRGDCLGHGLAHIKKVAVDSGALIFIEEAGKTPDDHIRRLVLLAHLAGILHDISRTKKEHAARGAEEAERILTAFPLQNEECVSITEAIRNHEAFRPCLPTTGPKAQLLSDVLYDADKFRWGPDNFTETLWAMIASRRIPLQTLFPRFFQGLEGIRKIRNSFRTPTGREYGPDFIDRGLTIGERLYEAMTSSCQRREE
jgi:hypothetical protein